MTLIAKLRLFSSAALTLAVVHPPAHADTLFAQSDLYSVYGYYSAHHASGLSFSVSDNFTLSHASNVTQITWEGGHVASVPVRGFQFNIYNNTGLNEPGSLIATQYVSGNANETFVAPPSFFITQSSYSYSSPVNFSLPGSQLLWLSIVADMPGRVDASDYQKFQWAWSQASNGDMYSFQDSNEDPRTNILTDELFSLYGTADATGQSSTPSATPEPSALVLAGTGLLSLAGAARRKTFRRK